MMKRIEFALVMVFIFSVGALGQKETRMTRQDYIEKYKDIAISEMERTGIPASITLAQGILESGDGNSKLARKANNHFGIKCHDWDGRSMKHDDDRRNECFRKYKTAEQSYRDHSDFLTEKNRYATLFDLDIYDYKAWAIGLKKAGYATSPTYAEALIRIIEQNQLDLYDRYGNMDTYYAMREAESDTSGNRSVSSGRRIYTANRINYVIAREGDTFESLAEELDKLAWELPKYNEAPENSVLESGQVVYIQPKRNKAEAGKKFHVVAEGENMYLISQRYGIKLKKLYEKNRMDPGTEPEPGKTLALRKKIKNDGTYDPVLTKLEIREEEQSDDLEFEFDLGD